MIARVSFSAWLWAWSLALVNFAFGAESFVNFETPPVHPVELGPDGKTLAVCNLPDNRVELFDVSSGVPHSVGAVLVGHDPVSLRFRTTNELWVVNHISSSLSVVDLPTRQVIATLRTKAGPADLVFAGAPQRAYVSCSKEDCVEVFDPQTRAVVTHLAIAGDRPKALAASSDGSRVYAAIFESGNASTILAPKLTALDQPPPPGVVADPEGPYHGQEPVPNAGLSFQPPMNPYLDTNMIPRGSLIVKKNLEGRWMDDNGGNWSEFVSGSKAARSGRIPGWDMPDRDLAVIDTATHAISYATGLMNICMAVAVNPANGQIAVVGTDAKNEIRFEPNLRGRFLRVQVALVDPGALTGTIRDLNPHLDYASASVPIAERAKSIGDPRGIVWNSSGTRAYITGMGSRNLIVVDAGGQRAQSDPIDLGEGPAGLALDEARGRLYVLNRFSSALSVVETSSLGVVATVPIFDPTPEFIKVGRRQFYDTRHTSSLGHVSCASCHVDIRFDRLAWDLGVPDGEMMAGTGVGMGGDPRSYHPGYHPMKGPMVTLTMQDIIEFGPLLHWRGDRDTLLDFHIAFTDLLAADRLPTVTEMRELELFLGSVRFPPNRHRKRDNTLSEDLPLPGLYGIATDGNPPPPLPNGNAIRGLLMFGHRELPEVPPAFTAPVRCALCHDCESLSSRELRLVTLPRSAGLTFRSPSLRSVADKVGMNMSASESRAGFGFMHDGRADTLTRFLVDGFGFDDNQNIGDMVAFLLSASGGDFLHDCVGSDATHFVRDAHASVGRQVTLTSPELSNELVDLMALTGTNLPRDSKRLDIIASGRPGGTNRTWAWNRATDRFDSDRNEEANSFEELYALASPESPITFMAVVDGSGRRMAIDRDDDGVFDRSELEQGSDPFDVSSPSSLPPPEISPVIWYVPAFVFYAGEKASAALDIVALQTPHHPNRRITFGFVDPQEVPPGASIDPTGTRFVWDIPRDEPETNWLIRLRALDNARPGSDEISLNLYVRELRIRTDLSWGDGVGIQIFPVPRFEIQIAESAGGPWRRAGFVHRNDRWLDWDHSSKAPRRFYRVVASH